MWQKLFPTNPINVFLSSLERKVGKSTQTDFNFLIRETLFINVKINSKGTNNKQRDRFI